jgi:predicted ATPase with chaperone activity
MFQLARPGAQPSSCISCYLHGCSCGFFGDPTRDCRYTDGTIQRYLGKISGPLLDRIDLHIEVPAVPYQELRSKDGGASSAEMRGASQRLARFSRLLDRNYWQ